MSLADFVEAHVCPSTDSGFVVRSDLVRAYTSWRQKQEGLSTMQLSDLDRAERDSRDVLPDDNYRSILVVERPDGRKGAVEDCWHGFELTWPGANQTEPELLPDMPLTVEAPSCDRSVHACFHFTEFYDPGQLQGYIKTRVTSTRPDDIAALETKLRAAVTELRAKLLGSPADWNVKPIEHEGLVYNVFVRLASLQAPEEVWDRC